VLCHTLTPQQEFLLTSCCGRRRRPIFVKFGDQSGLRGLGVTLLHQLKRRWQYVDGSHGEGTGNTALTFHAGALCHHGTCCCLLLAMSYALLP
jgi:hypothetical protein